VTAAIVRVCVSPGEASGALDLDGAHRLRAELARATAEASRGVVISSDGPDFCRGVDIAALSRDAEALADALRTIGDCLLIVRRSELPVIAAVNGQAIGFGVGLAAACDQVVAAADSTFYLPELVLGFLPRMIAPFLLRRISRGKLGYLASSARPITASEALSASLVDEIATDRLQACVEAAEKRLVRTFHQLRRSSNAGLTRRCRMRLRTASCKA